MIWRYFQALFASANLDPPVVTLTANSIQTLKAVIVSSDLITVLPRISIRNEEKNKVLRPIPLRAPNGGGSSPFFAAPMARCFLPSVWC